MNELNEIKVKQKTFSDSNICRNEESRNATSQEKEMVKTVSTRSPIVEVPTPQQKERIENSYYIKSKCVYECECKQCKRCSECDYTVNGLRYFNEYDSRLYCENCLPTKQKLTTLKGLTTSQIWKREKLSDIPAYCFLKTDELEQDIPVVFRIKENNSWIKPKIPKYSYLQVQGNYSNSGKSERPSFTAYSYQLLSTLFPQETINKPTERRFF